APDVPNRHGTKRLASLNCLACILSENCAGRRNMSGGPFRFLHASDFHLDQPLQGLAEVPDHLAELLADAPYQAATRVFDLALAENVDFVLLIGGLVDPHRAGPRGLRFLSEQFARLAEREITVYWATSASDGRERWPVNLHLPANVHLLGSGQ